MTNFLYNPASFRDPSGFVFQVNDILYRQVNQSYAADYDLLMQSGLYKALSAKKMLVAHEEVNANLSGSSVWYKTLRPEPVPFISYPYEWSFEQLKDAALLTLQTNLIAIEYGMIGKDATAFNVQFHGGQPVLIDTLSFEKYDVLSPWIAYRQFCGHFLFPLLLSHYRPFEAQQLLSIYIDGLPVEMVASMLPFKTRFNLGIGLHVHLQHKISKGKNEQERKIHFSKARMERLLLHLQSIIRSLQKNKDRSAWSNYYDETILGEEYLAAKEKVFLDLITAMPVRSVLDIGTNKGYFSKLLAGRNMQVTAIDADGHCINELYKSIRSDRQDRILPLIIDISNPSPAIGLNNLERSSFLKRVHADLVLALALIHHLVFSKNIPLGKLASTFSALAAHYLVIEFIPAGDEKIKLLMARHPHHHPYSEYLFEEAFGLYFNLIRKQPVPESTRTIYLFEKKDAHA